MSSDEGLTLAHQLGYRGEQEKAKQAWEQELDGGGLLIRDVTLLTPGQWEDSTGDLLYYPEAVLKKYAKNWTDRSIWSRHSGKVPRSITEKIGEVKSPRYRKRDNAVVADLWLHGLTQTSRDTIVMIKSGLANGISIEHGGVAGYNESENRYDASELIFTGLAVVINGSFSIFKNKKKKE